MISRLLLQRAAASATVVWLVLAGGCGSAGAAGGRTGTERLEAVLSRLSETGATYTARVVDVSTGRELYAAAVDEPYIPASNMKLMVSAAALDRFGPEHTFKTYLVMDGEDLWLIGTGDPATGDPRIARDKGQTPTTMLDRWADALAERGIERIGGHVYYDDRALDEQWTCPLWSPSFLTDWYAAPVSGLNFNDNCIDVTVWPTELGKAVRYEVMPPAGGVRIINECITALEEHAPQIARAASADEYTLSGQCSRQAELASKPVTDPGAFFANALRTHLASRGIVIEGETRRAASPSGGGALPAEEKVIAVHESGMAAVLRRVNKNSQNMFAEALCKLAGQAHLRELGREAPGSWEAGGEAVRAFLRKHGIDDRGLVVADGSGLARENRVTSRLITDLLVAMHRHPHAEVFRESLSVAGRDGTLAKRMSEMKGRVVGKTGYIGGVRALSGYARTRSGRLLAFSIIYNNIPGPVKPFEELQDEACGVIAAW